MTLPAKPRKDFPLFVHQTDRWAKKVRGKLHYFGKASTDPKGAAAEALWNEQKDDLLAGRTPRGNRDGLLLCDLCNHFLTAKGHQRDAGEITARSFADYFATCARLTAAFGRKRLVDDLAADDFMAYRADLTKGSGTRKPWGVHRLSSEVQRVRTVFKYGYDSGLIDKPIRFGPAFKRPAAKVMRAHRLRNGERMFEARDLRKLIDGASQPMKAMILLGINCGFGNNDCGTLPQSALDLAGGWLEYPRPKTAVPRRCPLWPETVKALREALESRPTPKNAEHNDLLFVTKYGQAWAKETADSPVTKEFRKLLDDLNLHRSGLGFYALRHTFETVAGGTADQVAVNALMGHVDTTMAGIYRERIEDKRLRAVVNHVRAWLFPKGRKAK